jgi:hypothetical protein
MPNNQRMLLRMSIVDVAVRAVGRRQGAFVEESEQRVRGAEVKFKYKKIKIRG